MVQRVNEPDVKFFVCENDGSEMTYRKKYGVWYKTDGSVDSNACDS
jgi:hypothetical protein